MQRPYATIRCALAATLMVLAVSGSAIAEIIFVTDGVIDEDNFLYEGEDIIVEGCALTINGAHQFNSVIVRRNRSNEPGIITHGESFVGIVNGLELTVATDMMIEGAVDDLVASRVDVSFKGHPASTGPGAGGDQADCGPPGAVSAAGAGHGGAGGFNSCGGAIPGLSYGTWENPNELGSGGGSSTLAGGNGGGRVAITVAGTFFVDGVVWANGQSGASGGAGTPGGGSGGSIFVSAGTLQGSGDMAANGGDGGSGGFNRGGGGGGGRIVTTAIVDNFTGMITAFGGGQTTPNAGGAGTLSRTESLLKFTHVVVDNGIASPGGQTGQTTLGAPIDITGQFDITGGAFVSVADPINVDGDILIDEDAVLSHIHSPDNAVILDINVTGSVAVAAGARIDVSGRGHRQAEGIGAGSDYVPCGLPNAGASGGGSHGGEGGRNSCGGGTWGTTYGSWSEPLTYGSGGGGSAASGGVGGGVIRLNVGETLSVDGAIKTNGESGLGPGTSNFGGGAGGSVNIRASALNGVGLICANGGVGPFGSFNWAGGGSGGRIAIRLDTDQFTGTVQAIGGNQGDPSIGAAGTVYRETGGPSQSVLVIDNGIGGTTEVGFLLRAGRTALLSPINVDGDILITGNAILSHARDPIGDQSSVSLVVTGDVQIDAGASIDVSYLGFNAGGGPGVGGPYGPCGPPGAVAASGAGHGGFGGYGSCNNSLPGATYGSLEFPEHLGSGGGTDNGGSGGGRVRIDSEGTVALNGEIRVNGSAGGPGAGTGGGGSGGSVLVFAGTMVGSGQIEAQGGDGGVGGFNGGGGGGGGRVAIHAGCDNIFPSSQIDVSPGMSYGLAGGHGTIFNDCGYQEAISIDPTWSYLRVCNDAAEDPQPLVLSDTALQVGDVIRIEAVGDYAYHDQGDPEDGMGVIAVFSSSPELGPTDQLNRVVGAIGIGIDFCSGDSFYDCGWIEPDSCGPDEPARNTDIAEDFVIVDHIVVEIPTGATHLWITAHDEFYSDNVDLDGDYGVVITPVAGADLNGDGVIDVADLLTLLSAWGTDDPVADLNNDGTVGLIDLLALLAEWG